MNDAFDNRIADRDAQRAAEDRLMAEYERRKVEAHDAMTARDRARYQRTGACSCPTCKRGWRV